MQTLRFHYSPEEDEFLRKHYPTNPDNRALAQQMSDELGRPLRTYNSIWAHCRHIGVARSAEVRRQAHLISRDHASESKIRNIQRAKLLMELGIDTGYKIGLFSKYEQHVRISLCYRYRYRTFRGDHTIYYDSHTRRRPKTEEHYHNKGFNFAKLP